MQNVGKKLIYFCVISVLMFFLLQIRIPRYNIVTLRQNPISFLCISTLFFTISKIFWINLLGLSNSCLLLR